MTHKIFIGDGRTETACPVCHAIVAVDVARRRLAEHKRGDNKLYNCPLNREEVVLVRAKPTKATVLSTQGPRKKRTSAAKKLSAADRDAQAIARYERRVQHLATRQARYDERDFAFRAADSFGKDDPALGGEHSVRASSGGRVQSNRSRY